MAVLSTFTENTHSLSAAEDKFREAILWYFESRAIIEKFRQALKLVFLRKQYT